LPLNEALGLQGSMNKFFRFVFLPFAMVAGFFYMFILPPMVATGLMEISALSIAFAAFMLLQLWVIIAEFAYESASAVFGFKRKVLFKFLDLHRREKLEPKEQSGFSVLFLAFISYLFMVYGYGVVYSFISSIDDSAFSMSKLGFIDGLYFSLVTSSTVGYGDITPKSPVTKIVVMSQIIISMAYIVMLFSSAVSYVREVESSPNKQINKD
jgi:voltage-gated potassium channel